MMTNAIRNNLLASMTSVFPYVSDISISIRQLFTFNFFRYVLFIRSL